MRNKIIDKWMLLLMAVLLTACNGSNEENNGSSDEEDCYLEIYVYAPGRPIVTRGDEGEIDPTDDESKVTSLKIWVFKYADGTPVGYLEADPSLLSATTPRKYLMKLDREFVKNPTNVDVYVVANAESYVTSTDENETIELKESTTRSQLDKAVIGQTSFGISSPSRVESVPQEGLPMSAVLRNQPIFGSFPTLHVGEDNKMATLELTRAVSKLRFVLCRIKEAESTSKKFVSIDGIQLNGSQIPTTSYLMPGTYSYTGKYDGNPIIYVNAENKLTDIPAVDNPLVYVYDTQSAQEYEDLIDAAVKSKLSWLINYGTEKGIPELSGLTASSPLPQLKQIGLTYLRESDKQLAGVINYTYKEKEGDNEVQVQATADFTMAAPGDFLRNHSWIVYVYYMDSKIHVLTVVRIGMKEWVSDGQPESPWFYNW